MIPARTAGAERPTPAPGGPCPLVVLAAMKPELSGVRSRLSSVRRRRVDGFGIAEGTLAGRPIVLACTGEGADNAARVARAVVDEVPARGLICLGVSGGLSPSLAAGSVVVADDVLDASGPAPAPDADWVERVRGLEGVEVGTVVSSPTLLCTAAEKTAAHRRVGRDGAVVVDLESAAVARVARAAGVPLLVVRAVSDTAGESLPLDFNRFREPDGSVDRRRVAHAALRHPNLIGPLWGLHRRVSLCSKNLARFIHDMVSGGIP